MLTPIPHNYQPCPHKFNTQMLKQSSEFFHACYDNVPFLYEAYYTQCETCGETLHTPIDDMLTQHNLEKAYEQAKSLL